MNIVTYFNSWSLFSKYVLFGFSMKSYVALSRFAC